MMERSTILEVKDLKKYFPIGKRQLHAVDGVSFSVERGTTLGVVGESGCGKTTLGRVILGLTPATSGEILFEGQDIAKCSPKQLRMLKSDMQIIFQDPFSSLNPHHTIAESIEEPVLLNGKRMGRRERLDRVAELMELVGLPLEYFNSYPFELDPGRLQRAGIARAISMNPKLIVCDEPVSALDVSIQAQILNLLMDLQDDMGLTYMFVTHDLSVVKHISNSIMVMYLGQCLEFASSDDLFANPVHPYTQALLSAIPEPDISMRNKEIKVIKGEVVSPVDPKPGCRFAARCEHCQERCQREEPVLREVSPGHFVACHLYGD